MQIKIEEIWDKFWRDKNGHFVIWQLPNAPLIAWAILTVISLFYNGTTANVFSWLGTSALVIWSILEILKGVNYFRRVLGLVILVFSILSIINLLK
jgi:uncharacterized membrane protein